MKLSPSLLGSQMMPCSFVITWWKETTSLGLFYKGINLTSHLPDGYASLEVRISTCKLRGTQTNIHTNIAS